MSDWHGIRKLGTVTEIGQIVSVTLVPIFWYTIMNNACRILMWELHGTGLVSSSLAGFVVSGVEPWRILLPETAFTKSGRTDSDTCRSQVVREN